jgi:hypothetical protein
MPLDFVEPDTTKRCLLSLPCGVGIAPMYRQQSHPIQVDYRELRVDRFLEAAGVQLVFQAQSLVLSSQTLTPKDIIPELWIGDNIFFLWVPETWSPEIQGDGEIRPIVSSHGVLPLLVARR